MKPKAIISVLLLLSLISVMGRAQHEHTTKSNSDAKLHTMSDMMGKPAFEKSFDGMNLRVWLITQDEHRKKMKGMDHEMMQGQKDGGMEHKMMEGGMKHDMKNMDHAAMDAMMAGTHHIMLIATDPLNNKEIEKLTAVVHVLSPLKKTSTVELQAMKGHFGGGLVLDEKGDYAIGLKIEVGGKITNQVFHYRVD